jgi:hypothetical protein
MSPSAEAFAAARAPLLEVVEVLKSDVVVVFHKRMDQWVQLPSDVLVARVYHPAGGFSHARVATGYRRKI